MSGHDELPPRDGGAEEPRMSFAGREPAWTAMLLWPIRRPWLAIGITAALALLSVVGVMRIRPETSLEGLFPRGDRSAAALVKVLNEFSVAEELLLLVSLPENDPRPSPQKLLAFAARLEEAVKADPAAREMADGFLYRVDPQTRSYIESVVAPAGIYYLDDAQFARARQRLTKEGVARQMRRNEALLATPGPAAGALAKTLLNDPLRLHEFLIDRVSAGRSLQIDPRTEAFLSPDRRSLLIRIPGRRPLSDIDFTKAFVRRITDLAHAANTEGLRLDFSGAYAIAAETEKAIRSDAISTTFMSLTYLIVLFALAYRGFVKLFILAFCPVALGNLLGFGLYSVYSTALTPMTAVIGAMLAEMGINYSIHYLSLYDANRTGGHSPEGAAGRSSREMALPLLAAWCTSVVGFFAVAFSSLRVLREFAILGTLALAGAVLTTVLLLPPILVLLDRRAARKAPEEASRPRTRLRFGFEQGLARLARHGRVLAILFWGAFAAVAAVLAWPGERMGLESDLTIMHPRPNPPLENQKRIADVFGSSPGSLLVLLEAESPEALVSLAHEVERRLASETAKRAGVSGSSGLATLLPDPEIVAERKTAFSKEEVDAIVADFRAVVADSGFEPKAFERYIPHLRSLLLNQDPPEMSDLLQYSELAGALLPRAAAAGRDAAPRDSIVFVSLNHPLSDRALRAQSVEGIREALAGLPGATVAGIDVISHDTESSIQRDLPRILGIGIGAVVLYLVIHYRGLRDMYLVVLPTAFSLACLLAVMRLTGQKLNLVNLVAAPLLIGINIDYGIFLVSLARSARQRRAPASELIAEIGTSCHAVVVCAITTMLGFGSLMFMSIPAVRSLGFAVAVGVLSCLLATLLYLAPLLIRTIDKANAAAAKE